MIEQEEVKSLSVWRAELKRIGKKHWLVMYKTFHDQPVSSIPRFYKALNLYGDWAMFEAIVDSAEQNITGDHLAYVLTIAKNKWKEMQKDEDEESEYAEAIEEAKKISQQKNDELEKKLKRARK